MKWKIRRTVDLAADAPPVERLKALATLSSRLAHQLRITVREAGQDAQLDGLTLKLSLILPDRSSLMDVFDGVIDGCTAVMTLPDICYSQSGEVRGVLYLADDADGLLPVYGFVLLNMTDLTDIFIDAANVVPSISELLAQIEAMRTATAAAREAARRADEACAEIVNRVPYVGGNGNWMTWNANEGAYADSGVAASGEKGEPGETPHIGGNGNWFIGDTDTGTPARGPAGQNGAGAGTVTGVMIGDTTYEPDESGVVALPEMGGGGVPAGGAAGQMLIKQSEEDGDAQWVTPTAAHVGAYAAGSIRVLEVSLPVSLWTGEGPYMLEIAEDSVTENTDCRFEFGGTQTHIAADIDWETTEGAITLSTETIPTGELAGRVILMEVSS